MLMKQVFLFLLVFLYSFSVRAEVQSTFEGPVKLKVWQHWQQSWNVENVTNPDEIKFVIERGFVEEGGIRLPYIKVKYRTYENTINRVRIQSEVYLPQDQWSMRKELRPAVEV